MHKYLFFGQKRQKLKERITKSKCIFKETLFDIRYQFNEFNIYFSQADQHHTFQTLLHDDLNLRQKLHEKPEYVEKYQKELECLIASKDKERNPWVVHTLSEGDKVYLSKYILHIYYRYIFQCHELRELKQKKNYRMAQK